MRMTASLPALVTIALLSGCAAAQSSQSSSTAVRPGPDCSFRSASTCWTVASRFPPPSPSAPPKQEEIDNRSPTVLASEADSASGSR
jgi:hypothetical protein